MLGLRYLIAGSGQRFPKHNRTQKGVPRKPQGDAGKTERIWAAAPCGTLSHLFSTERITNIRIIFQVSKQVSALQETELNLKRKLEQAGTKHHELQILVDMVSLFENVN